VRRMTSLFFLLLFVNQATGCSTWHQNQAPVPVLRDAVRITGAALGAAAVGVAILYLWSPAALVHGVVLVQRHSAGFSRHKIATAFGVVPYLGGGAGPVVVLLHGYQDQKDTWLDLAGHLTDRYRVLIPDLHGFGENHAATNGDYRPPAQAERVHGFLAALGVPAVNLAGVSMGGEIAGVYAAQYPGTTLSLAMFSAAGVRPDTLTPLGRRIVGGDDVFHVTDRRTLDTLIALIASGDSGLTLPGILKRVMVAEYRARNPQWDTVFRQLTESATLYLLDSIAPRITARTLVLWGARDPLFPVSAGRRLAARVPGAEFIVLPDCGHLCVATRAAEVARYYRAFLSRAGLAGAMRGER
jgi:abhydrolase domain-containing protein 6